MHDTMTVPSAAVTPPAIARPEADRNQPHRVERVRRIDAVTARPADRRPAPNGPGAGVAPRTPSNTAPASGVERVRQDAVRGWPAAAFLTQHIAQERIPDYASGDGAIPILAYRAATERGTVFFGSIQPFDIEA